MATLFLRVGFFQLHEIALADVACVSEMQIASQQVQGKGVSFDVLDQLLKFVP